ncbi:hypothetical protein J6590_051617 [Homalodisca vitripennis]|nr:hypothetical protein J6590_051617 [Homalodisca vitripennis]
MRDMIGERELTVKYDAQCFHLAADLQTHAPEHNTHTPRSQGLYKITCLKPFADDENRLEVSIDPKQSVLSKGSIIRQVQLAVIGVQVHVAVLHTAGEIRSVQIEQHRTKTTDLRHSSTPEEWRRCPISQPCHLTSSTHVSWEVAQRYFFSIVQESRPMKEIH